MVARHSSSDTSSIQLKYAFAALLYRTSILPKVLIARSTTAWHCSGLVRSQGCNDTILPPAALTSFRAARPLVSLMSQPTTMAPWRVKSAAAARPMLPPVPVMTHTLPSSRPLILSLRSEFVRSFRPDTLGNLVLAAVDYDCLSRDERGILAGKKHYGTRNIFRLREALDRLLLPNAFLEI